MFETMVLQTVKEIRSILPYVGTRKLCQMLKEGSFGIPIEIGRDHLFNLLRDNGMLSHLRKRYSRTTNSKHKLPSYPNMLKEASISRVNQVLVCDITYILLSGGKFCYLFLVTDYYSRKILGYALKTSLCSDGAIETLKMALRTSKPSPGFIHHSDHGIQYCCKEYIALLQKNGAKISMTGKDHCYDNAVAERINGILKQEFGLGKELLDFAAAKKLTDEGIKLYNTVRLHASLNYHTPNDMYDLNSTASASSEDNTGAKHEANTQ